MKLIFWNTHHLIIIADLLQIEWLNVSGRPWVFHAFTCAASHFVYIRWVRLLYTNLHLNYRFSTIVFNLWIYSFLLSACKISNSKVRQFPDVSDMFWGNIHVSVELIYLGSSTAYGKGFCVLVDDLVRFLQLQLRIDTLRLNFLRNTIRLHLAETQSIVRRGSFISRHRYETHHFHFHFQLN